MAEKEKIKYIATEAKCVEIDLNKMKATVAATKQISTNLSVLCNTVLPIQTISYGKLLSLC